MEGTSNLRPLMTSTVAGKWMVSHKWLPTLQCFVLSLRHRGVRGVVDANVFRYISPNLHPHLKGVITFLLSYICFIYYYFIENYHPNFFTIISALLISLAVSTHWQQRCVHGMWLRGRLPNWTWMFWTFGYLQNWLFWVIFDLSFKTCKNFCTYVF